MAQGSQHAYDSTYRAQYLFLANFLILFCLSGESARAEGVSLIVNGKSFHQEESRGEDYNENNWGLGLQYDYKLINEKWLPYLTISSLKDSYKRHSYYAGGGMMRRFSLTEGFYFDAGVIGFVMMRKDHHNRKPFLGALPAFSIGTDKIALNATYIPEVEPKLAPLWFVQLKLSFGLFN